MTVTARCGLVLAALSSLAGSPPSVAKRLAAKEQKLEQLYAEYWRAEYRSARGDKQASSIPAQRRIRDLFKDEAFLQELKAATFAEPLLRRRQKLFLEEAAHTFIFTDERLAKLVEAMGNDEAAMEYRVGERTLKRSALNELIAHEPERELRKAAWMARAQNFAVTGERVRQAIKLRRELGERYARRPYVDFMLERKGVPERGRLLSLLERYRRETRAEYEALLARIRRDLRVDSVEPWDLDYFFSTLAGDFETARFPRDAAWPRVRQVAGSLGFDFGKLPVDPVVTEISFGGGTYPILYGKEVKILVNRYDGIRFTDTLFHEAGHALHYALVEDPTFILRGSSSEPFDEGCGQIMALLLYRPEIGMRYFGLTQKEQAAIGERYRLRTIVDMLETIAESTFEFAAYEDPDQDLSALHARTYADLMGLDLHGAPVWAFDPYFSTGPVYLQSYVLAELVARQVHADLDRRFGREWDVRVGEQLRRRYFSVAGRMTLDEILERGTGEPLDPKHLIDASLGR